MTVRVEKAISKRTFLRSALLLFVATILPGGGSALSAISGDEIGAQAAFERYYGRLNKMLFNEVHSGTDGGVVRLSDFIKDILYVDRLAPQVLQKEWPDLNNNEKERFKTALAVAIGKDLRNQISRKNGVGQLPPLKLESKELKERFARLTYSFPGKRGEEMFTVFMLDDGKGVWKVSNFRNSEETLLKRYFKICDALIDNYSFAYLVGELMGEGYVVLEDFETSEVGKLPAHWTWKSKDDQKNKPYKIVLENGNKYLAANDNGESVIIGKNVKWNLNKYPYVSFRWRAHEIPGGGDERYGKTNDSAAGIYFIYKKKLGLIPESVKYVWSTTLPVGVATRRSGTGRPWVVVAESGDSGVGEWRTYTFDLREAYKKTFGGSPPDKPIGIGILSDANSTKAHAYADYDDIVALKQADADSGVQKHLKGE